jgi:hypothetical protein
VHLEVYQSAHQEVCCLVALAKKSYYQGLIKDCSNNQSKLFKITDTLLFRKKSSTLPSHSDSKELADLFGKYFNLKIDLIRDNIIKHRSPSNPHAYDNCNAAVPQLHDLKPVTMEELHKVVMSSNSKHCSLDPIPTTLLKGCIDSLLPVLCKIANLSMSSALMPLPFKQATVTPMLKKPSLDREDFKHYRPVSNLPYVSKLVERVVMARLNEHMSAHSLREPLQSAYRPGHSIETALVKVFDDILCAVDSKKCVLLVLLDMSAAFDTIDHNIMLQRLQLLFGISGQALEWLKSYFDSRTQSVSINNCCSSPTALKYGVPQGSVAGPSTIPNYGQPIATLALEYGVGLHLYADDTQLYVGCEIDDCDSSKEQLEVCIAGIRTWMAANMLKLNDSKTEYLVIGTKHLLQQLPEQIHSINIGSSQIESTSSARNIGVLMDTNLRMEEHIRNVCRSCYISLRDIGRIRHNLSEDSTKVLIQA